MKEVASVYAGEAVVRMIWLQKARIRLQQGMWTTSRKDWISYGTRDIGAPDAIEVIRRNCLLSVACKEEDIAFYIDQQDPCKGSMSGNY